MKSKLFCTFLLNKTTRVKMASESRDQLRKEIEGDYQRFLDALPKDKRIELEKLDETDIPPFLEVNH